MVIYEFLGMSSDPFSHLYELIFISYFVWVILKILMICFYISLIFLIF